MNSSNYTGRIARNLNEAFGPYCSPYINQMPEPIHQHDRIALWGCAIGAVAALIVMVVL